MTQSDDDQAIVDILNEQQFELPVKAELKRLVMRTFLAGVSYEHNQLMTRARDWFLEHMGVNLAPSAWETFKQEMEK